MPYSESQNVGAEAAAPRKENESICEVSATKMMSLNIKTEQEKTLMSSVREDSMTQIKQQTSLGSQQSGGTSLVAGPPSQDRTLSLPGTSLETDKPASIRSFADDQKEHFMSGFGHADIGAKNRAGNQPGAETIMNRPQGHYQPRSGAQIMNASPQGCNLQGPGNMGYQLPPGGYNPQNMLAGNQQRSPMHGAPGLPVSPPQMGMFGSRQVHAVTGYRIPTA